MYGFISSLQCLYARESGNFYAFDYSQSYKSKLIAYVSAYYEYKLPQNAKASLQHLMIAMESYAAYEVFGAEIDADEKFIASIESIVSILSGLSSEEREVFDGLIGDCYDKYFALYQTLKNVNAPNVDKYEDQIKDICTSVSVFNDVAATLTDEELTSAEITERLVFMFALYEKVEYMYGMLADTNDAQLFAALASTELEFKDMKSTLDMAVYNMRKTFISCALSYKVTEKDSEGNQKTLLLWDAYDRTDIDLFFRDVARLFEHRFIGTAISKEYVDEIMAACRSLSDLDATILYGIGLNCYYNSLHTFYANALKIEYETKYGQSEETTAKIKEATDLTTALFEAEIAYRRYLQNSDSEDLANNFIQKMDKAAELYKTLNDADIRDAFFKTMYEYYLGIYNEMTK